MAKTTKELRISLTRAEVAQILKKHLKEKFRSTDTLSVDFRIGTEYDGPGDDRGREVLREVVVTGYTEEKTEV